MSFYHADHKINQFSICSGCGNSGLLGLIRNCAAYLPTIKKVAWQLQPNRENQPQSHALLAEQTSRHRHHRKAFEAMNVFLENHPTKPVIDSVYSFENSLDAFRNLRMARSKDLSFEWGIHERLLPCCLPTRYTFKTIIT
jgi:hypothetical protein